MVNSSSRGDLNERKHESLNTNEVGAVTSELFIADNRAVGLYVRGTSGAHDNHVITLQYSVTGNKWFNSGGEVSGIGFVERETVARYVRGKVTTAEGAPSTCSIHIVSK